METPEPREAAPGRPDFLGEQPAYGAGAGRGLPWRSSDGVRPAAGVALEWFMRLLRVEVGIGLRTGDFGLTVDVNRDWWGLL